MSRFLFVICALTGLTAAAQNAADEWVAPPERTVQPGPVAAPFTPAPMQEPSAPAAQPQPVSPGAWPQVSVRQRVPDAPNRVSMFGAPALGQWKRGQSLVLGFPILSLRLSIGVLDQLDVGVGFDSFYGSMNSPKIHAKFELGGNDMVKAAVGLDAGLAFFSQRAAREVRGPRWITGYRNYNLSPGFILSYQGLSPRAARLFLDLRYLLSFDTEPFATDPLNGVPSSVALGHNVLIRGGAEMPLSERTSFVFGLGLDIHGRAADSRVMPSIALGLVTGL